MRKEERNGDLDRPDETQETTQATSASAAILRGFRREPFTLQGKTPGLAGRFVTQDGGISTQRLQIQDRCKHCLKD